MYRMSGLGREGFLGVEIPLTTRKIMPRACCGAWLQFWILSHETPPISFMRLGFSFPELRDECCLLSL